MSIKHNALVLWRGVTAMARLVKPGSPVPHAESFVTRPLSGVRVDEDQAARLTAVWACVRVLSETQACMSIDILRRLDNGDREELNDHPAANVLRLDANPEMSAQTFKQTMEANKQLWGNGYAEIERRRDRSGAVENLWLMDPRNVEVDRDEAGNIVYIVKSEHESDRTLQQHQVFHLKGLGNGLVGLSPIRMAAEAIGLSLATERFGAAFFGNSARPATTIRMPSHFKTDDKRDQFLKQWERMYRGPHNASKTAILEDGASLDTIGVPPEEAQFLETRHFQIREITRIFRLTPHKINDLADATFSNIEQQNIEFVTDAVVPNSCTWEAEISRKLIAPHDRRTVFARFNVNSLMRGDTETRFKAHALARQWGWESANDVRKIEGLNRIPGDSGDIYLVPLNMVPSTQAEQAAERRNGNDRRTSETTDRINKKATSRLFADAAERVLRKESKAAVRASSKCDGDPTAFKAWAETFYAEHAGMICSQFLSPMETLAELSVSNDGEWGLPASVVESMERLVAQYAEEHVTESKRSLSVAFDCRDVEQLTKAWMIVRPPEIVEQLTEWTVNAVQSLLLENSHDSN